MSKLVTDKAALLDVFPYALARDEDKEKMAESVSPLLAQVVSETDRASLFTQIYALPEWLLDILASDFKVDWYDYEGTVDEKRKTIQECMFIHRYKGTKYAVETALRSVYSKVTVNEWFEYGGEPFHFNVAINDSTNDREKRSRILEKIQYYKNLRSVLDSVTFKLAIEAKADLKVGIKSGSLYKRIGGEVKSYGLE